MNKKIIPSDKLLIVSNSKLKDLTCWRKYFFRWVLNLEPRGLNLAFWYGGVLGAGFEALVQGKKATTAAIKEDIKRQNRHPISPDIKQELEIQREVMFVFLKALKYHPEVKKMKLSSSQEQFRLKLKKSRLLLCSSTDGMGVYGKDKCLFEIKTSKYVTKEYLNALKFGRQVNSYAANCRANKVPVPKCCVCVFRKPSKVVKRNQTPEDFIEEIRQDLKDRRDFYIIFEKFSLGRATVTETLKDIEELSCILRDRFLKLQRLGKLYSPNSWPKEPSKCYEYKGCPFLPLCQHPDSWEMYLRFYQQREMLYEEEGAELCKSR